MHDHGGQLHAQRGTLVLADISGYTAFLRAVGDAHAADMAAGRFVPEAYPLLTSLLGGIVERLSPPFALSKLEGDAVFVFAAEGDLTLRGDLILSCLDECYRAYRSRLDEVGEMMICTCDACRSIGTLELKFVLHHGDYVVQRVSDREELLGPDVTIAHLLLKNHVADLIGRVPYALFTEPAAAYLDVPVERTLPIAEHYEHYPAIRAFVLAL